MNNTKKRPRTPVAEPPKHRRFLRLAAVAAIGAFFGFFGSFLSPVTGQQRFELSWALGLAATGACIFGILHFFFVDDDG
jgi:H+/Cl- antiporter ClcA